MSRRRDILDDPVVAEVRRWRAQLQEEAGGTLEGLMRLIHDRQVEHEAAGGRADSSGKGKTRPPSPAKDDKAGSSSSGARARRTRRKAG